MLPSLQRTMSIIRSSMSRQKGQIYTMKNTQGSAEMNSTVNEADFGAGAAILPSIRHSICRAIESGLEYL